MPVEQQQSKQLSNREKLAVVIGIACAVAAPLTMEFEGKRNVAYADRLPARPVPTVCFGHTGPEVRVGDRYTNSQCANLLQGDLRRHAEGVAICTPAIADHPVIFAAVTDFTFNLGVATYCRSTAARLFRRGDWRGGCQALGRYVRAGGRVVNGLVRRRAADVELCLKGVPR